MVQKNWWGLAKPSFLSSEWDSDEGLETDLEVGQRRPRKGRQPLARMIQFLRVRLRHHYKLHPGVLSCVGLVLGFFLFSIVVSSRRYTGIQGSEPRAPLDALHSSPYKSLRNLVMVAGHAVYTGSHCEEVEAEKSWFLEPYQKHPGQASTFVSHIKAGVEIAAEDPKALLLFSGGETRKDAGPRSEAQSYWNVAESKNWFEATGDVRGRALTEEHARDSFENLLFSICRFKELTGSYPHNITVVSYDFKSERFTDLHREAIRFPQHRFFFVGTPAAPSAADAAALGESKVLTLFRDDPYGCAYPLSGKRLGRDPFARKVPYPAGCPELGEIFAYCGRAFYSPLPWDP